MKTFSCTLALVLGLSVSLAARAAEEEPAKKPEEKPKPVRNVTLAVTGKEVRSTAKSKEEREKEKDNKDGAVAHFLLTIVVTNRNREAVKDLAVTEQVIFQELKGKRHYYVENLEDQLTVEAKQEGKLEKDISSTKEEKAERRIAAWVVTVKDAGGNLVASKASDAHWAKLAEGLFAYKTTDRFDDKGELVPAQ